MTSLYIHVPFCLHKCAYCDFCSFICGDECKKGYVDALCEEIRLAAERYKCRDIGTIFIGGGTPSSLSCGEISRIMQTVSSVFNTKCCEEATIECNPGTVEKDKLCEYRECGINRISFGLQSTDNRLLRSIDRIHTYEDFLSGLETAKSCGFTNINADIMYGLPGQSVDDFVKTLEKVAKLGLSHISAYSLILEEGTPLYESVRTGKVILPDEDDEFAMHRAAASYLQSEGFRRYEISNYAKTGCECRHNLCYWDVNEYIGLGLNSHSCIFEKGMQERHENTADLSEYEAKTRKGNLPIKEKSIISGYEQMAEYVMLGTRKTDGFSLAEFRKRFGKDFADVFGETLNKVDKKYYTINDYFSLTDEGLDMQNFVLCELL